MCDRRHNGWVSSHEVSIDWWLHSGYLESLAFRANLWTLDFENIEIGIILRGFPFDKCFYYILVNYFQNSKIFSKNDFLMVFQKPTLRYFRLCEALLLS